MKIKWGLGGGALLIGGIGGLLGGAVSHINLDANFWSAVFGAVIGGGISLLSQYLGILDQRKVRKEQDRKRAVEGEAVISLKMYTILKTFIDLEYNIAQMYSQVKKDKWDYPCLFWGGIIEDFVDVKFTYEDLLFVNENYQNLIRDLQQMETDYNQMKNWFLRYSKNRSEFVNNLKPVGLEMELLSSWDVNKPNILFSRVNHIGKLIRYNLPKFFNSSYHKMLNIKRRLSEHLNIPFDEDTFVKTFKVARRGVGNAWAKAPSESE